MACFINAVHVRHNSVGMRSEFALVVIALAGCAVTPRVRDAYEGCSVSAKDGWRQISVPSESEMLLDLPTKGTTSIRWDLATRRAEQSAWFRNSNGNLLACAYTPIHDACSGGNTRTVEFRQKESSWEAGPTMEEICVTAD